MTRIFPRLLPLVLLSCSGMAWGQLATSLRLSKTEYLSGEPIVATLSVTNNTGRAVEFQGYLQQPWLDFMILNQRGEPAAPTGRGTFGKLKLPAGQSFTREVNLSAMFQLTDRGNYSVMATVRMPGADAQSACLSNRVLFNVSPGVTYWSQKVASSRYGAPREFRILNFSGDERNQLYAQVIDGRTGLPVRTFSLGEALSLRRPTATVDGKQRLNVLYLGNAVFWVHCVVDTDGRLVTRTMHKRGSMGDPFLVTTPKGEVSVANSVPYDPKVEAEERAKRKKLSDRPPVVY